MKTAILTFGVDRYAVRHVSDAGLTVEPDLSVEDALAAIRNRSVAAVLHGAGDPLADATVARLRGEPAMDAVAQVAILPRGTFLAAELAFSSGADDVAGVEEAPELVRRLETIARGGAPSGPPMPALVADPERSRRTAFGRVLRRAGFDVRFAIEPADLADVPMNGCVVADAELAESVARAGATAKGLWVVTADRRDTSRARALTATGKVAVHDRAGAIENVLFHLNELGNPRAGDARATARVLWSSPVRWRVAGADEGGWGMAFNLNQGGVYVRTLGALPGGTAVWVEMQPEGASRRVHLEAKVVWQKPFGATTRPLAPAGMGMVFTDATAADKALLDAGYERLLEARKVASAA
jgi:Tfp pilus assembly protein PilZ